MAARLQLNKNSAIASLLFRFKSISPWDAMLIYMAILVLYGLYFYGLGRTLPLALSIISVGSLLDWWLHKIQKTPHSGYPRSGLITTLIVTVLMPVGANIWMGLIAVTLAILSKHYLRAKKTHIFNPAAFGTVIAVILLGTHVGWWTDSYMWLVLILGIFNIWRARKFWQVGSFLVIYALLILLINKIALWQPIHLYLTMPWFFILFMVPEPVTSPRGRIKEIQFGVFAALLAVIYQFMPLASKTPLLLGLLSANLLRFTPLFINKKQ